MCFQDFVCVHQIEAHVTILLLLVEIASVYAFIDGFSYHFRTRFLTAVSPDFQRFLKLEGQTSYLNNFYILPNTFLFLNQSGHTKFVRGSVMVKALCCKPGGRGFET
jgi:hypothetical protein